MSARVRAAGPDDAPAIAKVHVASWRETYAGILPQQMIDGLTKAESRERWAAAVRPGGDTRVFVAEVDGEIVGFASGCPATDPDIGAGGMLDFLYMVRAAQGRGLGRALAEAVAGELAARGFPRMGVIVHADNPALGFYKAIGGRVLAERNRPHRGFHVDEVLLDWDLPLSSGA